ncbi:MAG TPA: hypothetical protein VM840_10260 [Actinomycetota bacterium]|nr:hypothetical protein [Actinomycetota bacterium]
MRSRLFLVLVCVLGLLGPAPARAEAGDVRLLANVPYTGGTEIAFEGPYVYAGQINGVTQRNSHPGQGGVFVFRRTGAGLDLVSMISCGGNDNDVMVVRPGLIAISHHVSRCNPATRGNGIFLVDVSKPERPRILGGVGVPSAHTLTVHPGGRYIYVSPGGLGNGDLYEYIVDVSVPKLPAIVSRFRGTAAGCHDLSFDIRPELDRHLAFCAGAGEIQTWDVRDPVAPRVIATTSNPAIQFPHNAVVSPDGTKLVINDEAFGVHECKTETSVYGSLWIYDIRVPNAPVPVGRIAPPAGPTTAPTYADWADEWCTAHNYNFVPGTDLVVTAWFTGGTTVHDISNPVLPKRVASYRPDDAVAYTAHWYAGRIYVNDMRRGMDVIEVDGVSEGSSYGPAPAVSWPRVDRTRELLPSVMPPRPDAATDRSVATSLFCVVPDTTQKVTPLL